MSRSDYITRIEARAIRQRLGMKHAQMARIFGCPERTIIDYETGSMGISYGRGQIYRYIHRLGEIALARRPKLDWSL